MDYHIGRLVLSSLCVGAFVAVGIWWCSFCRLKHNSCVSACNTGTTQTQPHQISNTQRTENKTTDVVIQQHSRRLLKMDILMSETCWTHNKWNKIASDIKLLFNSPIIAMMHGPINIRFTSKNTLPKATCVCPRRHQAAGKKLSLWTVYWKQRRGSQIKIVRYSWYVYITRCSRYIPEDWCDL